MDTKMRHRKRRRILGVSITEVSFGLIALVPLFLTFIDLCAIVLGQISNDTLAKRAARAAGQQRTLAAATPAANTIITSFRDNGIVSDAALVDLSFNARSPGNVIVETRVNITIPAPVPFVPLLEKTREMRARATEPIVMLPPSAF